MSTWSLCSVSAPGASRRKEVLDLPNLPCVAEDVCRVADEFERRRLIQGANHGGRRTVRVDTQKRAGVRIGGGGPVDKDKAGGLRKGIYLAPRARVHVGSHGDASRQLDRDQPP